MIIVAHKSKIKQFVAREIQIIDISYFIQDIIKQYLYI